MSRLSGPIAGAALAALLLSACGGGTKAPMSRETFETVIADLRAAELQTDSAGFEARRAQILGAAGVTDSLLLEFVRAHEGDLEFMTDVWVAIDRRVNAPPGGDPAEDSLTRR